MSSQGIKAVVFVLGTFLLSLASGDLIRMEASSNSKFDYYDLKSNGKVIAVDVCENVVCSFAKSKGPRRKSSRSNKPITYKKCTWAVESVNSDTMSVVIQDLETGEVLDKYYHTRNMLYLVTSDSTTKVRYEHIRFAFLSWSNIRYEC